jgi:hypothetical protein
MSRNDPERLTDILVVIDADPRPNVRRRSRQWSGPRRGALRLIEIGKAVKCITPATLAAMPTLMGDVASA